MTPRQLSVFDLAKVPSAIAIIQRNDPEEVATLLHQYGFDMRMGVEYVDCWHRPLTNKTNQPVYGVRIEGVERVDQEWFKSGNASQEALTENIDPSLRDDLIRMGKQGGSDKVFTDERVARSYVAEEKKRFKEGSEE